LIFVMGLYPNPFIEKMDPAIQKLVAQAKIGSATAQIPATPAMTGLPAGHPPMPEPVAAPVVNPHEAK
jgi:NADH-quinone oxidoreductase subunit M